MRSLLRSGQLLLGGSTLAAGPHPRPSCLFSSQTRAPHPSDNTSSFSRSWHHHSQPRVQARHLNSLPASAAPPSASGSQATSAYPSTSATVKDSSETGRRAADQEEGRGPGMAKKTVRVDVTSDTVCPWCYVGKKNLEAAIGQLGDDVSVEVTWHPFQLNPNAPKEGVNKAAFYNEKFGPRVPMIMQRMSEVFAGFGQKYSLGGLTGNTLDSHRLLWFARNGPQGSPQMQNALADELFLDYFTREKYLGDREVLVAAAERMGLSGAREFLSDPQAGAKEVQQEMKEYGKGVTGVPFFRIDGQQFSGAQPPEVFVEALTNAKGVAA